MKKVLSVLLAVMMLMMAVAPSFAFAAADSEATPIVYVRGNGQKIYNADGEVVVADIGDLTLNDENGGKDKIVEAVFNILTPFLVEGLAFDKWDNYGKAIYEELSPLFEEAILDGNGNPQFGTHVDPEMVSKSKANAEKNIVRGDGKYDFYTYGYYFDWRLDPYEHVDDLHEYIKTVLKSTGKSQVSLTSRCLGGSVLNAYLEKYGSEGLVKNVMFCETLSDGCALISKGFSGQIEIDTLSMQRYMGQLEYCGELGLGVGFSITEIASDVVAKSIDLLTQTGALDTIAGGVEYLYSRLYKALIPALFHSFGYASQPIYWTMVEEEDFDLALDVMFGEEGSEAREYYAGLIEKITNYRTKVTSQRDDLYKKWSEEYGIHMGVMAKYGMLNAPFTVGHDDLADALVSLKDSSLGATCAKIDSTLSDKYINEKVANGYGAYISPDKQVDASTCTFPNTTWFIKNVHHDDFDRVGKELAVKFLNETNVTVDNSGYARFRVNNYDDLTVTEMTEDNCDDLYFITSAEKEPTGQTMLASLFGWLISIFNAILKVFGIDFTIKI